MSKLLIPKPGDFSFDECLWFLNRNYDDCLHIIGDKQVSRAIVLEGRVSVLTITENEGNLVIDTGESDPNGNDKAAILRYVCEWFDLDRDISPFYRQLSAHPVLGYMAGDFKGLRVMNIPDVFEALVWSIIGQQINLTFAFKLKRAMVEKYGTAIAFGGDLIHAFPEPAILAAVTPDDLRELQFSRQKAAYVINAATVFRDGVLSKDSLWNLPTEEKIAALTALKGVGRWTANYVVMKSLNDTTGVPHGDVGLLKALEDHQLIDSRKNEPAIAAVFGSFPGWESYLVHYLWRSLAIPVIPTNS
jgi:DNA-3-methyladenine glycosylase II